MNLRPLALLTLLCALLTPAPARALDIKLDYRVDLASAASTQAGPNLTFVDDRPDDRGAGEINRIGHLRAGMGFPYPLKTRGTHVDTFLTRWVTDCLAAAGWDTSGEGGGGAELRQTLEYLWVDGYMAYDFRLKLRLELYAPGASAPGWSVTLEDSQVESVEWTANEMNKPINKVLERQSPILIAALSSSEFGAAMGGRRAKSAPAARSTGSSDRASAGATSGASASGGCTKDTECKGDRVCNAGKCEDP